MDQNKIEKLDITKIDWRSSREFFQSLEDELRDLDDKDEKYDFTCYSNCLYTVSQCSVTRVVRAK